MLFTIIIILINVTTQAAFNLISSFDTTSGYAGDRPASQYQKSYMALIMNIEKSLLCGGTLLSEKWILTSGYCLYHNKPLSIQAMFFIGDDYKTAEFKSGTVFLHPFFQIQKDVYVSHDIGLFELENSVSNRRRITLYGETIEVNDCVSTVGWGINEANFNSGAGEIQIVFNRRPLYEEDQRVCDKTDCRFIFGNRLTDFASLCRACKLCKVYKKVTIADGGGPVLCNGRQIGIIPAFPYKVIMHDKEKYSLWVKIEKYIEWINNTIQGKQFQYPKPQEEGEDRDETIQYFLPLLPKYSYGSNSDYTPMIQGSLRRCDKKLASLNYPKTNLVKSGFQCLVNKTTAQGHRGNILLLNSSTNLKASTGFYANPIYRNPEPGCQRFRHSMNIKENFQKHKCKKLNDLYGSCECEVSPEVDEIIINYNDLCRMGYEKPKRKRTKTPFKPCGNFLAASIKQKKILLSKNHNSYEQFYRKTIFQQIKGKISEYKDYIFGIFVLYMFVTLIRNSIIIPK